MLRHSRLLRKSIEWLYCAIYAIHRSTTRNRIDECFVRMTPSHCASAVKQSSSSSSCSVLKPLTFTQYLPLFPSVSPLHFIWLFFFLALPLSPFLSLVRLLITFNCTCNSRAQAQWNPLVCRFHPATKTTTRYSMLFASYVCIIWIVLLVAAVVSPRRRYHRNVHIWKNSLLFTFVLACM